jgi:hypothetical protein
MTTKATVKGQIQVKHLSCCGTGFVSRGVGELMTLLWENLGPVPYKFWHMGSPPRNHQEQLRFQESEDVVLRLKRLQLEIFEVSSRVLERN